MTKLHNDSEIFLGLCTENKPPIGLVPHQIWHENRIIEIREAIKRYLDAGLEVNVEWIKEYNYRINIKEDYIKDIFK